MHTIELATRNYVFLAVRMLIATSKNGCRTDVNVQKPRYYLFRCRIPVVDTSRRVRVAFRGRLYHVSIVVACYDVGASYKQKCMKKNTLNINVKSYLSKNRKRYIFSDESDFCILFTQLIATAGYGSTRPCTGPPP